MSIAIATIIQIADDRFVLPIVRSLRRWLKQLLSYTRHYLTIIATSICESHSTTKRVHSRRASVQQKERS